MSSSMSSLSKMSCCAEEEDGEGDEEDDMSSNIRNVLLDMAYFRSKTKPIRAFGSFDALSMTCLITRSGFKGKRVGGFGIA